VKLEIRDAEVLRGISPFELAAYLRVQGWQQRAIQAGRFSVWEWPEQPDFEVLLPLDRTFRDFALRVSDIFKALEQVENRSEYDILLDLVTTSADVIRARLHDVDAAHGTIPIEHGVTLVSRARDLISAAASAAVEPREYFGPRRPTRVTDYVRHARLGQTEWGSYAITIISRVNPELRDGQLILGMVDDPFERKVVRTLAAAVNATQFAAEQAALTGNFEAFSARVRDGVSANLCEALVGMAGGPETNRGLTFEFSWSRSRPPDANALRAVRLPPEAIPVVAEAGRIFREASPREDFIVIGPVVRLDRPEGAPFGRAVVVSFLDDRPVRISIQLDADDYAVALAAHGERLPIYCAGTLIKDGRSFVLRDLRDFRVVNAEP
jgi:hypothetical protein